MELSEFLNDFVVSTLFMLDLGDPDYIRIIEPDIELNLEDIGSGRFSTNAAILLADQLKWDNTKFDAKTLAEELVILFEIEPFVAKASADEAGNITIELKIHKKSA